MTQDPNMEFMVRLFRGEDGFRILLSEKGTEVPPDSDDLTKRRRLSMIRSHRKPDDLLGRRKGSKIIFYDMGQTKVGSDWVDTDISYTQAFTGSVPNPLTLSQFTAIAAILTGTADRATVFKKLTNATIDKYGLDLSLVGVGDSPSFDLVSSSNYQDAGLSHSNAIRRIGLMAHFIVPNFDTDNTNIKVTKLPDYTAAVESLVIPGSCSIFLSPQVCTAFNIILEDDAVTSRSGLYQSIFPRSILLDTPISFFTSVYDPVTDHLEGDTNFNTYKDFVEAHDDATGSVATAPLSGSDIGKVFMDVRATDNGNGVTGPGALLAIIDSGSDTYYIWATEELPDSREGFTVTTNVTSDIHPPDAGLAPVPIVSLEAYEEQSGLAPTPGTGIPTKIHRRVFADITGGYVSGPWAPSLRRVQKSRDGTIASDVTADFTGSGWGIGSYSAGLWEIDRIFRAGHPGLTGEVYVNGTQTYKVRDAYTYGATTIWSDWVDLTLTWPADYAPDSGDEAYLVAHSYFIDDS